MFAPHRVVAASFSVASILCIAIGGCSDGDTSPSSPAPPVPDGTVDGGAPPPDGQEPDAGGRPAAAEHWLIAVPSEPPGVRVAALPKGGVVVYGNRTAPETGAFVASLDRFGAQRWLAPLGAGHVACVTVSKSGLLISGYRTLDFMKGLAGAFAARLSADGAIGFQTEWPSSYARGIGIGEDMAGNIVAVGMVDKGDANGWDVSLARFAPTGASTGTSVIAHAGFDDLVHGSAIDDEGNAYVVSTSELDSLTKLTSSGDTLWGAVAAGQSVHLDASGNVRYLAGDRLFTFAPDGTKLAETTWRSDDDDSAEDFAVSPKGLVAIAGMRVRQRDSTTKVTVADAIVTILDASGARVGEHRFPGSGVRAARSVAFDAEGALVVTGRYDGEVRLEEEGPTLSSGSGSHFVARVPIPTSP